MVKFNAHGIQGDAARWNRNWLAVRRQRVCIKKSYSNWAPVTSGVLQGSVLGPLLSLMYINGLDTNIVSKISKFADDTKLSHRARNPEDIIELQEDINKLVDSANKWQINFNVDKCSVNMSSQQLQTSDQQQDLGIIITKDHKWQKQTDKSCKTVNRVLGIIARNFRYKNKELILLLYKSLGRRHLEQAVQFWFPYLRLDIDKVGKIHKRATR